MSTLTVQNIQGSSSSSNTINVASGHKISGAAAGALTAPGMIVQTVVNTSTSTVSTSSSTPSDLITASISPKFSNSVIHIEGYVSRMQVVVSSNAYASLYITDSSNTALTTTVLGSAISNSSPMSAFATHSPSSTSSQTYKLRLSTASGGTSSTGTDGQRYTIKLTEIAQ